jgi:hypothetical protein
MSPGHTETELRQQAERLSSQNALSSPVLSPADVTPGSGKGTLPSPLFCAGEQGGRRSQR